MYEFDVSEASESTHKQTRTERGNNVIELFC